MESLRERQKITFRFSVLLLNNTFKIIFGFKFAGTSNLKNLCELRANRVSILPQNTKTQDDISDSTQIKTNFAFLA